MTVPASQPNRYTYAGNGVTQAFAYSSKFLANADLVVLLVNDTTGAETTQTLTTHYTVTGAGTSAGTVTFVTAPASGYTVVIYGDPVLSQLVDPVNGDALDVDAVIEAPLDKLTILVRRVKDIVTRSLRQPEGDTTDIGRMPALADRLGKFLFFNATTGDPEAAAGTTEVPVSAFMATVLDDATAAAARTTLGAAASTDVCPVVDTTAVVKGSADATKQLRFEVDGFTTATTRVLTPPNFDGTIATLADLTAFISGQAALTAVDMAADYVPIYDTSAAANKKATPDYLHGGVRPAFGAQATNGQSIGTLAYGKVQYTVEDFDTNSNFDNATNYRFTPTVAGIYTISACVTMAAMGVNNLFQIDIRKNGTSVVKSADSPGGSAQPSVSASCVVSMNGSTDYIEVYAYNGSGGSQTLATAAGSNYFSGVRVP